MSDDRLIGGYQPDDDLGGELPNHAAARFARRDMTIFPVDMRPDENGNPRKQPPRGYAWKQRATSVLNEVVEDFVVAEQDIGVDYVGVAWAVGLDGKFAVDLDGTQPDWWHELTGTAVNPTKRGEHRIFDQPPGRRIGNSTSRFPSQGWGEVRGVGGYIVIWWPGDRPGFDVDELDRVIVFPQPAWLTDSDTVENAACTPVELEQFKHAHTTGNVGRVKGFETALATRDPGTSRNYHAAKIACWIAREAAADLVPARDAFNALERWWAALGPEPDTNGVLKTRTLPRSEILRVERWALGQLVSERVEEVRAKADAERAAYEAQQKAERDALDALFRPPPPSAPAGDENEQRPRRKRPLVTTPTDTVALRRVRWLWRDRLPLGSLLLLGGREGVGKSILAYTLAAQITRGTLSGELHGQPRAVVVSATEDSWSHTIKPRLLVANADLKRVHRVQAVGAHGTPEPVVLPFDVEALADTTLDLDAALVILDPIISRLDAALDTHRDSEVRQGLEPLAEHADRGGFSVLGLIHVNKGASKDPLTMLMASRAFVAVARSVLFTTLDPEQPGMRLLGEPKNNLGRTDLPTLLFDIVEQLAGVDAVDGTPVTTGALRWQGVSQRTIEEAVHDAGRSRDAKDAQQEAEGWLRDYLRHEPVAESKDVKAAAKDEGIAERTLHRAREKIGAGIRHVGFPRRTIWSAPGMTPEQVEKALASRAKPSEKTDRDDVQPLQQHSHAELRLGEC
jgi:hypothetical protein